MLLIEQSLVEALFMSVFDVVEGLNIESLNAIYHSVVLIVDTEYSVRLERPSSKGLKLDNIQVK